VTEPTGPGADREFDVVVIGAGAVGENAADYAHRGGLSTVLVESALVGGECSYWACMPSKALLRTPDAVAATRRLPGVTAMFDVEAVLKRRDAITRDWNDASQVDWAEGAGITVVRGRARLEGERLVRVGDELLRARHAVVVCTGSVPVRPPVPGLDEVRTWTSRDATSAHAVPRRLGVLGGGVVGCELSQAWQRLGSEVVLLVRGQRLLESAEPFASERVAAALRRDGVDLRLGTALDSVAPEGEAIALRVGGEEIIVDELLLATGHRPPAERRGRRPGGGRPDAGRGAGRRRLGARRRRRGAVALRRGRHHRSRAAHPRGQVRGADRRGHDRRARRQRQGGHRAVE
jgi:dihydrolipoamide dehydrogenase